MFCGTVSAIGGILPAHRFEMKSRTRASGRKLRHGYDIDVLPVIS